MYEGRKKLSKPKTENTRNPFLLKKKKIEIKDALEAFRHFSKQKKKNKKERNYSKKKKLIIH